MHLGPALQLLPGEGARAPAGSPVAADFIRAVAAAGQAGGRVCLPEGEKEPELPPPRRAAATAGGDGTRAARGGGRPGDETVESCEERGREGMGGGEHELPLRGSHYPHRRSGTFWIPALLQVCSTPRESL